MGLYDFKKNMSAPVQPTYSKEIKTETIVIEKLPENLEELQNMPGATLDDPFGVATLVLCGLCAYGADKNIGKEMLNWLRGPRPLSNFDISFLNDRFMDGNYYIPFSYFNGATPENNYTPDEPLSVTISTNSYSYTEEGYCKLSIKRGGADTPRSLTLRINGEGKWFLWEQDLRSGIRIPKSQDKWA